MAERKVTEVIAGIKVGESVAVYDLNPVPSGVVVGFGKALCMERIPEALIPLTYKRTFDSNDPNTSAGRCTSCPLRKNCVIVEKV